MRIITQAYLALFDNGVEIEMMLSALLNVLLFVIKMYIIGLCHVTMFVYTDVKKFVCMKK